MCSFTVDSFTGHAANKEPGRQSTLHFVHVILAEHTLLPSTSRKNVSTPKVFQGPRPNCPVIRAPLPGPNTSCPVCATHRGSVDQVGAPVASGRPNPAMAHGLGGQKGEGRVVPLGQIGRNVHVNERYLTVFNQLSQLFGLAVMLHA